MGILLLTLLNGEVILRWKGQRVTKNENAKRNIFAHISWKVERFTSNQYLCPIYTSPAKTGDVYFYLIPAKTHIYFRHGFVFL